MEESKLIETVEGTQAPNKPKKKYEKPQITYSAPLEAVANICLGTFGKASTGMGCTLINS